MVAHGWFLVITLEDFLLFPPYEKEHYPQLV